MIGAVTRAAPTLALLLALAACGPEDPVAPQIAVVSVPSGLDLDEVRRAVARAFYEMHPDDYDLLVVWDTTNLRNAVFGYHAVANEVRGIGVAPEHDAEVFDDGGELAGTTRLRGVVWMGNRWRSIEVEPGPESVLGILAEETGHRWGVHVRFDDGGETSDRLVSADRTHWSAFVDSSSPLGGFPWTEESPGTWRRLRREEVRYSDFDLYLMGLMAPAEVAPTLLLTGVSSDGCVEGDTCARGWDEVPPEVVQASARSVPIDAVIDAEGSRVPDAATGGNELRQAWVYVTYDDAPASRDDLARLRAIRLRWESYYAERTRGRGDVRTDL